MKEKELHFHCDMCGLCCQNLALSALYEQLDRGDGTCMYYEEATHKCSIYAERPLLCNVEAFYEEQLAGKMEKSEYFELNYKACRALKSKGEGMTRGRGIRNKR